MFVTIIENSLFTSCSYLVNGSWLIDCGDVEPLLALLNGGTVNGVLLTHGHFDHIYGLNELCDHFPDVKIYCSEWTRRQLLDEKLNMSYYHEMPFTLSDSDRINVVADGEVIDLGGGLTMTAIMTPGHTPGCITWMTQDELFTGDAYIPGVKLVTKLPFGDKILAAQSVETIKSLAVDKKIYPGHYLD